MVPCLPVLSNAFLIFEGVTQDTLSSAPKADPSLSLVTHMTQSIGIYHLDSVNASTKVYSTYFRAYSGFLNICFA